MLFDVATTLKPEDSRKLFGPDGSSLQLVTQQFDKNRMA